MRGFMRVIRVSVMVLLTAPQNSTDAIASLRSFNPIVSGTTTETLKDPKKPRIEGAEQDHF